jgi:CDP-diacylglycerol--serine O-phosphatidyltransferase
MIFDFLDGFAARVLKAYSELGKELDSLADVVSFGVAPAVLIYTIPSGDLPAGLLFIAAAAIMPVCAALRLAKFNIDPTQTKSFRGLPTPANAFAVISVIMAAEYSSSSLLDSFTTSQPAVALFSVILSALMVTRIPLFSLKFSNLTIKDNYDRYLFAVASVLLLIIFGFGGLPWIIPVYIVISLLTRFF